MTNLAVVIPIALPKQLPNWSFHHTRIPSSAGGPVWVQPLCGLEMSLVVVIGPEIGLSLTASVRCVPGSRLKFVTLQQPDHGSMYWSRYQAIFLPQQSCMRLLKNFPVRGILARMMSLSGQ